MRREAEVSEKKLPEHRGPVRKVVKGLGNLRAREVHSGIQEVCHAVMFKRTDEDGTSAVMLAQEHWTVSSPPILGTSRPR